MSLTQKNTECNRQVVQLKQHIDALQNSTSWQMTAFVRQISKLFKKIVMKAQD
jgi:hypothetical protein